MTQLANVIGIICVNSCADKQYTTKGLVLEDGRMITYGTGIDGSNSICPARFLSPKNRKACELFS
jgi:hypothetical protein